MNGRVERGSGLLETAVKISGDLDVHHFTASHVGVRGLNGTENAGEFACLRINLCDREAHGANTIDVALVVVLLQLLVIASQCHQTLGVLHTGGEGRPLGSMKLLVR